MRHRRIANPDRVFRALSDPTPWPGAAVSLRDELVEAGVPPSCIDEIHVILEREAIRRTVDEIQRLVLSLGKSPTARALERVLLGDRGRSLADDAEDLGCTKQTVAARERAVRSKLRSRSSEVLTVGT